MAENGSRDEPGARAATLLAALERYRASRVGRALDGAGRDGAECLIEHAASAEEMAAHHRRRVELVERAVDEEWMGRAMAEDVYDVAREEGLEPAFAFELVRCGVAVCDTEEPEPMVTALQPEQPEWLEPPVQPEEATRERRLRTSFRRLRHLMEDRESPEEALIAFAAEPDVRTCGY